MKKKPRPGEKLGPLKLDEKALRQIRYDFDSGWSMSVAFAKSGMTSHYYWRLQDHHHDWFEKIRIESKERSLEKSRKAKIR